MRAASRRTGERHSRSRIGFRARPAAATGSIPVGALSRRAEFRRLPREASPPMSPEIGTSAQDAAAVAYLLLADDKTYRCRSWGVSRATRQGTSPRLYDLEGAEDGVGGGPPAAALRGGRPGRCSYGARARHRLARGGAWSRGGAAAKGMIRCRIGGRSRDPRTAGRSARCCALRSRCAREGSRGEPEGC
jgi:hypothetical protein